MPLEYVRNYFYVALHCAESTPGNSVKADKIKNILSKLLDLTSSTYLNKKVTVNYFPKRVLLKQTNARKKWNVL
jgi:hypothetical protein